MNSCTTIQEIQSYLDHQHMKISENSPYMYTELVDTVDRLISYSEELKRQKKARIEELVDNGPRVHQTKSGAITITIFTNGREEFHCTGYDYKVEVLETHIDNIVEQNQLVGTPDENGYFHMLKFTPISPDGPEGYSIQLTWKEAMAIQERLDFIVGITGPASMTAERGGKASTVTTNEDE